MKTSYTCVLSLIICVPNVAQAENLHEKYGPSWNCSYIDSRVSYYDQCKACEDNQQQFYLDWKEGGLAGGLTKGGGHCVGRTSNTPSESPVQNDDNDTNRNSAAPAVVAPEAPRSPASSSQTQKGSSTNSSLSLKEVERNLTNQMWSDAKSGQWEKAAKNAQEGYNLRGEQFWNFICMHSIAIQLQFHFHKSNLPIDVGSIQRSCINSKSSNYVNLIAAVRSVANRKKNGAVSKPKNSNSNTSNSSKDRSRGEDPRKCVEFEFRGRAGRWLNYRLRSLCAQRHVVRVRSCFAEWAGGCYVEAFNLDAGEKKRIQSWDHEAVMVWEK